MPVQDNPTPYGCGCITLLIVAALFFVFVSKPIFTELLKKASFVTPGSILKYEFAYPLGVAVAVGSFAAFIIWAIVSTLMGDK